MNQIPIIVYGQETAYSFCDWGNFCRLANHTMNYGTLKDVTNNNLYGVFSLICIGMVVYVLAASYNRRGDNEKFINI